LKFIYNFTVYLNNKQALVLVTFSCNYNLPLI
jgi:hypothetical protein